MRTTKILLNRILFALLGSEELVEKWWKSPNKGFAHKKPEDIENLDEIYTYLSHFM
jgi:hypothetical protein